MSFRFTLDVADDGSFQPQVIVPNGRTVLFWEVLVHIVRACQHIADNANLRVLTVAEEAALSAEREAYAAATTLPEGWEPTRDGVNVEISNGAPLFTRTYHKVTERDDQGEPVIIAAKTLAPCGPPPDGVVLPETVNTIRLRDALLARETAVPPIGAMAPSDGL